MHADRTSAEANPAAERWMRLRLAGQRDARAGALLVEPLASDERCPGLAGDLRPHEGHALAVLPDTPQVLPGGVWSNRVRARAENRHPTIREQKDLHLSLS